jgi:hypothetical protein
LQLQQLFAQTIMGAFQRVAYPLLCRSVANPQNLKRQFGRLAVTLMLVSLLLTALVGANSRAIVSLLGPDWVAAAGLLRITAWAIPAGALLTIGSMLCLALGISGSIFKSAAMNLIVFIPLLLIARRWELAGLAICWSATRYLLAGAVLTAGTRRIAVGLASVWRELARLLACAAAAFAVMYEIAKRMPPVPHLSVHLQLVANLIISCAVGTAVYGTLVLLIEREALAYAIRIARGTGQQQRVSAPEPPDATNSLFSAASLQPDMQVSPEAGGPAPQGDADKAVRN